VLSLLVASTVTAGTVSAPSQAVEAPVEALKAPRSVDSLIVEYSLKYGVSATVMRQVIKCESGFNPKAVGDGGNSFGLVQIHLPSHPYVSRAQALDPEFAVLFLADKLSKNQGYLWTCYRKLQNE
jgi:soluble lytic murein transglycosylase-like protein